MLQQHRNFTHVLLIALSCIWLFSCQQGTGGKSSPAGKSVDWNDSCYKLHQKAMGFYNNDQLDSLEHYVPQYLETCRQHGERNRYYQIWSILAQTYIWSNQFEKATAEATRMQEEAKRNNEKFGMFLAYRILGVGYAHADKHEEAAQHLRKSIDYVPKDLLSTELQYNYRDLCVELECMNRYKSVDSTLTEWRTSLKDFPINLSDEDVDVNANLHFFYHSTVAEYMLAVGKYKQAQAAIDSAAYYEVLDGNLPMNLISIELLRSQLARAQHHTADALAYSEHLVEMGKQSDDTSNKTAVLEERTAALEMAGRFEDALKTHQQLDSLKDSLSVIDQRDRLNHLNRQYAVSELQAANQQLEQRSRFTTGSIAMIMGICAILVFLVYNSRWSRQLEIKNQQLQRERNLVVAQNKQLAVERDRAEAASKAKTAFIQSMTHEIRTPLNHISGFTQVLAMPDLELSDEERLDVSLHIQEGTHHLTTIIDDLILISDLESSSDLPPAKKCSPALIVSQALDEVRQDIAPEVSLEAHCQVPDTLEVNNHQHLIQAVLSRLLSNAAKFTHLGSITLSLTQEADQLHFSVADTGPGIPADKRDFIFERFAKLDSFAQGTGLGLSVARMIAERLGGTLNLDPNYTGGSKFDFIIPASFES